MNQTIDLDRLSHDVIGAAIEVHRHLGPGFGESIYEEALAIELALRGMPARRQVTIPIHYKDATISEARVDFLVQDALVVELKAVESIHRVHMAQVISYMKAGGLRLGLLINFNVVTLVQGVRRLTWGDTATPH